MGGFITGGQTHFLVDGNGRVINHAGLASRSPIGEDWAGEEAVQRVVLGETNSIRTHNLDGLEIIASFSPLSSMALPGESSYLGRDIRLSNSEPSPQTTYLASYSPSSLPAGSGELFEPARLIPVSYRTTDRIAKPPAAPEYGMVQTSWGLVIEESWAELTRTSQQYGRWLLLLLVLGAVAPAVVIGVGARQVTRPIARFSSVAREMAGGKLDQVITVRTGDELEELAEQFNRMSAQLRVSYADLEQRVADRTRELTTLNGIAADVSRSLDLDDVFSAALARTLEATGMEVGLAYCLEDDGETLALIAHRGLAEEPVRDVIRLPFGASAAGRANQEEYPVVLDVSDCPESSLRALLQAEGLQMAISIPLTVKGRIVGAVNLGSLTVRDVPPEELSLLAAIGQQMGVAVENAQLYEQAEASAVIAERNRLARDLHDAVTQTLFAASLIAEVLPRLMERKPDEGRRRLAELRELTRGALAEMRTLLLELRPSALVEVELGSLLQQLAESITGRARVPVVVKMEGECVVPADVKVALYRIAQEALNNVAKHAGASEASVSVRCQAEQVTLQISDDGRGFGPADVSPQSLGVGIMRERAKAIGAELEIKSEPEQGTRVVVVWPRVQDQARKPYQ